MDKLQALKQLMEHGHCASSVSMVHNTQGSLQKLVNTYFYYIKECIKKDFPSLEYMRKYYDASSMAYGGFLDIKGEVTPCKRNVFVGDCDAAFTSTLYNIHLCWVRHNSRLKVVATDHSHLHIDCYEQALVDVHIASPNALVKIHQYGNSKVVVTGNTDRAIVTQHSSNN